MDKKLNKELNKEQKEFVNSKSKYSCLIGGIETGKVKSGITKTLNLIKENGSITSEYKYIFGVYSLSLGHSTLIKNRFIEELKNCNEKFYFDRRNKILVLPKFNANIVFRSMESNFTGCYHADFWVNEIDNFTEEKATEIWENIVRRNIQYKSTGDNTGFVSGAPEGFKFIYNKFYKNKSKDYLLYKTKKSYLSESVKEYFKDSCNKYELKRYLKGEFINLNS